MRYHVAVKFVAILLCAVSLLTLLGSAGGFLVLTEMDLYHKTVDQVIDQELEEQGRWYASEIAQRYASENLGGCPEELIENELHYYSAFSGIYQPEDYGYTLMDLEGNALETRNPELKESGTVYTFPVLGQYMHLISAAPEEQLDMEPDYGEPERENSFLEGSYGVYDAIPEGGNAQVYGLTAAFGEESSEGVNSVDSIGLLYYRDDGTVAFQSTSPGLLDSREAITHIIFYGEAGEILYEAADPDFVGTVYYDADGYFNFLADRGSQPMAAEAEIQGEEIYAIELLDLTGEVVIFQVSSKNPVGEYSYDDNGYLIVTTRSIHDTDITHSAASVPAGDETSGILLYDARWQVIGEYHGRGDVGIGFDGSLCYTSLEPVLVPMATELLPEEAAALERQVPTEQTAPSETVGETIPQVTVPVETAAAAEESQTAEVPETIPAALPTVSSETIPETEAAYAAAETVPETTAVYTIPETVSATEPMLADGRMLDTRSTNTCSYYDPEAGQWMQADYAYAPMPGYNVEVYISSGPMRYESVHNLLRVLRSFRNDLFLAAGISMLVFAIMTVYLCCAAGHKPKTVEIQAGGLSRVPMDLNLGVTVCAVSLLAAGIAVSVNYLVERNMPGCVAMAVGFSFLASLSLVGFFYACVAQFKTPGGYWWKNTCFVRFFVLWFRMMAWLEKWTTCRFFPWLVKTVKKLWRLSVRIITTVWTLGARILKTLWQLGAETIRKISCWLVSRSKRFLALLPMTWQWMAAGFLLIFLITIATAAGSVMLMLICMTLAVALVLYVSHCFGILMESTKRMSKGDLDTKVDDKQMAGCFQEFAGDLNDLADVAVVAAQKQLKSERMKTELITNVSHDIKTPLTSIINYVDLLQKPHTEEEGAAYLEVLERQSLRLKKLIEDLMDMSKASTGNMTVDIMELDAVECINQALGEFGDKLERAQLIPVFRHSQDAVMMRADGRLVWRVMSNLLSNAVKYAMPGTRLYIDLMELEGKAVISLKNISRDELNMEADELMERFVRGDDSRNTEGSGLGLNIAKSLMELQKGQLQLLVDGDLFKVTLIFPGL